MDNYISLYIPAFNAEKTIEKSIKSILQQTLMPKEIIIIKPNENPFWEKIPAAFLYFSNSKISKKFLSQTSLLIEQNLQIGNDLWFLDQIILSINFDRFLKEEASKIGTLDINIVCDTDHNNNSLIWQLATNKSDNQNYDNYKKLLDK